MLRATSLPVIVLAIAIGAPRQARAQTPAAEDNARAEASYAVSITQVADSAIHRLDFFPARAQLRVQMIFAARDSVGALFAEINRRSLSAALVVDQIVGQFETIRAPEDLRRLHADLVSSLHAARGALDRLAASAIACEVDATAVQRCQTPFTSASSALGHAYKRYLDTRLKIRDQVTDTHTVLPEFKAPE